VRRDFDEIKLKTGLSPGRVMVCLAQGAPDLLELRCGFGNVLGVYKLVHYVTLRMLFTKCGGDLC